MTSEPRIEVALTLTGRGFSPEDVTTVTQFTPTNTWRVGDVIGKSKLKRKQDGWVLRLPQRATIELDTLLVELLDLIEPHKDRIAEAVRRFSLDIELSCAIYIQDQTPICNISATTICRLAAMGADLDLDLILLD